ncbi:MAG: hypothetical protein Q8Q14_10190 [Gemmatimonadales bacterium]|nr:hypothetical protein [Gemmatimonadales bacterium]
MKLLENLKPTSFSGLVDIDGNGLDSEWVNLANYGRVAFLIIADTCGATPAVTVRQAIDNVGGGTPASFPLREYRMVADTQSGTLTSRDVATIEEVTANTFNLANDTNRAYLIECDAQDLTVTSAVEMTHIQLRIADPSAAAVIAIVAIAGEARNPQRNPQTALD